MTPKLRARLYTGFKWAGTALGATEAGVLVTGHRWLPLDVSLAVYGYLSARVHNVAREHVSRPDRGGAQDG